jgi:transposase
MKTVEKHLIKKGHDWYQYCIEVSSVSRCLYNTVQYTQRQSYFYGHGALTLANLNKLFKSNEHYKALPAKVSQLVLKQNADAWMSYYAALSAYKKDSTKFTVKPNPPSYIESRYNLVKFNNQAVGKREFTFGWVVPSMSPIRISVKRGMKYEDICEVRIVPKVGCFVVEVVYEIALNLNHELKSELTAAIDIGLDNLATVVFNDFSIQPLIINGRPLKSANKFYNKQVAFFKGFLPQGIYNSKRLENLTRNRHQFVDTYIHTATLRGRRNKLKHRLDKLHSP